MIAVAKPRRKLERRLRAALVRIVQLEPECEVCGKRMDGKFLHPFPGAPEKQACNSCINDIMGG